MRGEYVLFFVEVVLYNQQKKLAISQAFVEKVVLTTLEDFNTSCNQVIIHLVGKKRICTLHKEFFDDPSPTDCISFPIENSEVLGEIFICPQVAIEYAKQHDKVPLRETALYIVHGLLHLLGYDDLTPQDIKKMRALEKRAMKKLDLTV